MLHQQVHGHVQSWRQRWQAFEICWVKPGSDPKSDDLLQDIIDRKLSARGRILQQFGDRMKRLMDAVVAEVHDARARRAHGAEKQVRDFSSESEQVRDFSSWAKQVQDLTS